MDPITMMMIAATVMKGVAQLKAGAAAKSEGQMQGMLYDREAALQQQEGQLQRNDAVTAAAQRAFEVRRFRDAQSVAYANSGVMLEGTPLLVLEETRKRGQQEVNYMLKRGIAMQNLMNERAANTQYQGMIARAGGRAAMTASGFGAMATGLDAMVAGQRMGNYGGTVTGSSEITNISTPGFGADAMPLRR